MSTTANILVLAAILATVTRPYAFCQNTSGQRSTPRNQNEIPAERFEAISIRKVADPLSPGRSRIDATRIFFPHITLQELIEQAYDVSQRQILWDHAPAWYTADSFEIEATTNSPRLRPEILELLRGALSDRFGLSLSSQTRLTPVLSLRAAKRGPKRLSPLAPGSTPRPAGPAEIVLTKVSQLVAMLNGFSAAPGGPERLIVDDTGLPGIYDIRLTLGRGRDGESAISEDEMGGLKRALEQQLGLTLVAENEPVNFLIITNAHPPSAN